MRRNPDDTVILRPQRRRRGLVPAVLGAVLLLVGAAGAFVWLGRLPAQPSLPPIAEATEAELQVESPTTLELRRFAPNPAIVVLDFPTLAEQGRMLNRVAAWAEKAGVPHDRVLTDAELAAAIKASGTTPETYYYGHDYRSADIARFFQLADAEAIKLDPDEEALRRIMARAGSEPFGVGALITLPRADAANQVDAVSRAVILHHELSHGEYFTNATYNRYVHTIWNTVLTEAERALFRSYLSEDGYDPALEDLMINEMQAYMMYTPDARFFDVAKLGIAPARLAEIRQSFATNMPSCWLRNETSATPTLPGPVQPDPVRAPRRRAVRGLAGSPAPGRRRRRCHRAGAVPRSPSAVRTRRRRSAASRAAHARTTAQY
jgi:hypothetical protein